MECQCRLVFNPIQTRFSLSLPAACVQPAAPGGSNSPSDFSDLSKVCILCADDQNPPRLQVMNAAQRMGIPIQQARELNDVRHGVFRDEPNLKLFGQTADQVRPEVWSAVAAEWRACPAVLILDQNIAYDGHCVYGTDICKQLRELKFTGVIVIRSGNDNESDKADYETAGVFMLNSPHPLSDNVFGQAPTARFLRHWTCLS